MMTEDPPIKVLADSSSVALANSYIESQGRDNGEQRILRFWRGEFYRWDGTVYRRVELEEFRAQVYEYLKGLKVKEKGKISLFKPEPRNVKAVIDTLATECQAHKVENLPAWIDQHRPDPDDIIAFKNGLLDLREASKVHVLPAMLPPTPMWFSTLVIPYELAPLQSCPSWLAFLDSTMRKDFKVDTGAISLLQEWFGYCMTTDTRHQKLLLLVGPPRCGKGTIIRALQRVVGHGNCASPAFASLTETFGLEPLLGKRIATIPDAHIGRSDNAVGILDRILQISGEDRVTVNRKYLPALADVKLGVRFTIGANEPPALPDSSGAIITRMLMIQFRDSFAGREDLALDTKLAKETAGVALWAVEGLKRLRKAGSFSDPSDALVLRNDYMRQTAPIFAFVQDRCELGSTDQHWVSVDALWSAWSAWCKANGQIVHNKEMLGKRLRAFSSLITKKRVARGGTQQMEYVGLRVLPEGELPFGQADKEYPPDL